MEQKEFSFWMHFINDLIDWNHLFVKYLNANIPPRARIATPRLIFSIPESSPTSPSCFKCLKRDDCQNIVLYCVFLSLLRKKVNTSILAIIDRLKQ